MGASMTRIFTIIFLFIAGALFADTAEYDIVIRNGRVMDPETRLDKTGLSVGINGNRVAIVTDKALRGRREIDATGLVVAPGFIDNLTYSPTTMGVANKIADGVTTLIDMHGGSATPETWYPLQDAKKWPVNYGVSFFYTQVRNAFGLSRYKPASEKQIQKAVELAAHGLSNGCLGISFSLEYNPGITSNEIVPLMRLADRHGVPVYFHTRYSTTNEPDTGIKGLEEVIGYARETGAMLHIDHITSTGGTFCMPLALGLIDKARREGMDVTACLYPYHYWATYLNSARFDKGWQRRFNITYSDLQLGGHTNRLTPETFAIYRAQGKLAIAYAIPEEDVQAGLRSPFVMLGSDAILSPNFNNHPRASGAFCRTIGVYVRERKVLSLMDALKKMTLDPARRLEKRCPAMRIRGRLSAGSAADITIFDYDTISDRATPEHPEYRSTGVRYVIINGVLVKDGDKIRRSGKGIAIKSDIGSR